MKLGRFEVQLAQNGSKNKQPPKLDAQIGTASNSLDKVVRKYFKDPSTLKPADFDRMRRSDGTVMALYNILTLPILASTWDIERDEDIDPNGEQAAFVRDAFELPPERGGMSTPFQIVLADMLRAVVEGYRYFEKVYTISPQGKIVYRKLASYEASSLTIRTDDHGGFDGAEQTAMIGMGVEKVIIPVEKSFLFTYRKEINSLEGESAFVAAYKHYEEKKRLYYLGNLQAQSTAIPARIGKVTEANKNVDQSKIDEVAEALSDLVELNSAVVLPFGFDAEAINSTGKMDIMPLINHHNAEMARSVLAHFLMLGDTASGSWALSKDQTDIFSLALKGLIANLEYHINAYLIPDLTEYNFANPSYPRIKFSALTDTAISLVADAFQKILEKAPEGVPDYLIEGIMEKMALQLGIDRPEGEAGDSNDIGKSAPKTNSPALNRAGRRFLAKGGWRRKLTAAESRVNLGGLQKKLNSVEEQFAEDSKKLWDDIESTVVAKLQPMLEAGDYKSATALTITKKTEYTKLINDAMLDVYTYAKNGAADEIDEASPATPNQSRNIMSSEADSYVTKQFGEVEFNIRSAINESLRKSQLSRMELSVADLIASISAMIEGYYEDHVKAGVSAAVGMALNLGRDDVFKQYEFKNGKRNLDRFEYSAILDGSTCNICADLDGTVVSAADYWKTKWNPPIHFYCRCLWIAIKVAEEDKPEITGFIEKYGGVSQPTLTSPTFQFSHTHNHYAGRS